MGYLVFILSVLIIGIFTGYEIALYVRKRPKNIEKLLGAVLVGTNFFHILSSIVLNELILKFYPKESSVFISGFITTIFVVLLGEYIPKILASLKPDLFIKYFTKVVSFFGNIFYPIIIALEKSSKIIENKEGNKKEILYLIWRKEKEGFLTREYSLILKRVANFEKEKIRKAIRTDKKIITARIGENIKNMREFIKKNYSKINKWILLLKNNNLYEIAGLVELISIFKNESWEEILKETKEALIVHESEEIGKVLQKMNLEKKDLIIVIDEFGNFLGIVEKKDFIDYIYSMPYKMINKNAMEFDGDTDIETLRHFGIYLPQGDYLTLSGFLEKYWGEIPKPKQEIIFGNYKFTIKESNKVKIKKVKIEINY